MSIGKFFRDTIGLGHIFNASVRIVGVLLHKVDYVVEFIGAWAIDPVLAIAEFP